MLTPEQQTSAAVIRSTFGDMIAAANLSQHRYVFDQFNGLHLDLINHLTQSQECQLPECFRMPAMRNKVTICEDEDKIGSS
jgi:hypothetical protein